MTHNNTIEQIDNLVKRYLDCADNFAKDPFKFIDEMSDCLQKKQTQKDLADKLNYPQHLVKHIIEKLEDIYIRTDKPNSSVETANNILSDIGFETTGIDDADKVSLYDLNFKTYIQEKTNGKFLVDTDELLNSFSDNDEEEVTKTHIYLKDSEHWCWEGEEVPISFNVNELKVLTSFSVTEKDWYLYLRLDNSSFSRKNDITVSSQEEKQEVLEMLRLMQKYLK